MCGVKNKLLLPEFLELITKYDIFICLESKLDDFDILNLPPGYSYFTKNRKKFQRKSGGILFIYKTSLKQDINFQITESEFVLWVKLNFQTKYFDSLLIGCVYVPPEGSRYTSPDAFIDIENEMLSLKNNNTCCALFGDFNARCSNLLDYDEPDDDLLGVLNYDSNTELTNEFYDFNKLCLYNIPLQRNSMDNGRVNDYGKKLIEICKNNNLYIVNGRVGIDKNVGKTTSKESSIVDYFLASSDLFPLICEFEVLDFDPLISDIHCRLHASIRIKDDLHNKGHQTNTVIKPIRWNADKKQQFVDKVENKLPVIELCNQLDTINNANELNDFVLNLNSIFVDSAESVFGTRKIYEKSKDFKINQPWFSKKCHEKRKDFHKAKKKHSI